MKLSFMYNPEAKRQGQLLIRLAVLNYGKCDLFSIMVRERGLEPLSDDAGWILSPVRLPIPPLSHIKSNNTLNYSTVVCQEVKRIQRLKTGAP